MAAAAAADAAYIGNGVHTAPPPPALHTGNGAHTALSQLLAAGTLLRPSSRRRTGSRKRRAAAVSAAINLTADDDGSDAPIVLTADDGGSDAAIDLTADNDCVPAAQLRRQQAVQQAACGARPDVNSNSGSNSRQLTRSAGICMGLGGSVVGGGGNSGGGSGDAAAGARHRNL